MSCFTALLARGGFYVSAVCFIIANIAYQAGLQFYDAMLPEVSHEGNRGKISGIGVGVGYLGLVHRGGSRAEERLRIRPTSRSCSR